MAYIKVIQENEAEGRLKQIYDDIIEARGKLAEVHKIQSLNPESIKLHIDFYMHLLYGKSLLKRYQREMLAVVVSVANQCKYCTRHHAEAMNMYWKDDEKLEKFIQDYNSVGLSELDVALCKYANDLTVSPYGINQHQVDKLIKLGFAESAVLDAAMIISYFNFVNRMVLGLGVHLEEDGGKGYKY